MAADSSLRVEVVFLDLIAEREGESLRTAITELAQGTWAVQGGLPGRSLTFFISNLPRGTEDGSNAIYVLQQQAVRISLPTLRLNYSGDKLVRALARAVVHEVTHAAQHAERETRGVREVQDEFRSRTEYYFEGEEMEARRAETAADAALYPGLGLLPRPDQPFTQTVSGEEALRYRQAFGERLPRLMRGLGRRAETRDLRATPPEQHTQSFYVGDEGATPRLAALWEELARSTPGWRAPSLQYEPRKPFEQALRLLRQQCVSAYLAELQEDYGLQPWSAIEPRGWKAYVEGREEKETEVLRQEMLRAGGNLPAWGALSRRVEEMVRETEASIARYPRLREQQEEASAFYSQVVLGEKAQWELARRHEAAAPELEAEEGGGVRQWLAKGGEELRAAVRLPGVAYNRFSAALGLPLVQDIREKLKGGELLVPPVVEDETLPRRGVRR